MPGTVQLMEAATLRNSKCSPTMARSVGRSHTKWCCRFFPASLSSKSHGHFSEALERSVAALAHFGGAICKLNIPNPKRVEEEE